MSRAFSRRTFLKKTAVCAGAVAASGPYVMADAAPNSKLAIALVGTGGRGTGLLQNFVNERIVALVDPDEKRTGGGVKFLTDKGSAEKHKFQPHDASQIKTFKDYRKLFDAMGKEINAIVVATPNHHHALPALIAMQLGIACYVEKPMAHDVNECRLMAEFAKKYNVATQMGNQGHSGESVRTLCEYIWAGAIGKVTEVYCWSDRANGGVGPRPPTENPPAGMDWDMWIGPAPYRDYHKDLHPHEWHGWHDFGNGSLGNMGCHVMDGAAWALKLEHPTSIEVEEQGGGSDERFPTGTKIRWDFPARGDMPPVKVYWYDGKRKGIKTAAKGEFEDSVAKEAQNRPPLALELEKKYGRNFGGNGAIYVGDKGMMVTDTYCGGARIVPEEQHKATPKPEKTLPRVKGSHAGDFLNAVKTRGKSSSDFECAARLTEVIMLGSVAMIAGLGKKVEWDGPNMKVTNLPELNKYVKREYRKGWSF
jgi:predicted dehydrogenase